ncbi:MAG: glycine cleavage T C-terminal barrel domain-containing protein [Planctomycetota bacterium]
MSDAASEPSLAGAFWAPLPDWSALRVAGPDAAAFLQSFCTNDVAALRPGEACEAFFTDVKAHVLAYTTVARDEAARDETGFSCVLSSPHAGRLGEHLDRYLIREDVELAVETRPLALLGAAAPAAEHEAPAAGWGAGVRIALGAAPVGGAVELGAAELERLRLRLGVPRDAIDVDERNLPQEVDRNEQAISFTKGCYLGQEPVARIDALGRVNRLLRGVRIDGPTPNAGDELFVGEGGKPIGRVTSATDLPAGDAQTRSVALAYVRREHAEAGTAVVVGGSPGTVSPLPMAD